VSGGISATIQVPGKPKVKLEGASVEEIEAASGTTQPFGDDLKASILEIAARGKRVHLHYCPGTRYLVDAIVYEAFDSSRKGYAFTISQANAV